MKNVTLVLQDGTTFKGQSFGYDKPVAGEVVFNTAMMGYPESLTDPSYAGQLMTLTYPLVGNYGVPPFTIESNGLATFMESDRIHASAIIVADYSQQYSHWNACESLAQWLKREKVTGITLTGFYYPLESTPFPVATNNKELEQNILNFDNEKYQKEIALFLKDKGCIEDGHASERIVDLIEKIMKDEV